ncbi:MAG: Gfo/Idh/MocA family oxidoreductase [Bacteroidetes bacterium]|jgi:UDP-N-acetyl-2-amino-2-deoxyglucuronate dehydrogenase|nr:Gfo/Idh/MocA family oxidoreductase [Bacteroidota bacterium]
MTNKNIAYFALIGAAGYIAPRHMRAIKDTNNELIAALDPFDSVGIIDSYFPDAQFFTEPERFDRHLDKLRRKGGKKVDYVSICSPNYLHDAHIRMALRNDAHAICEKPLVLNPWNIDALMEIEKETGKRIFTILQLRHHPAIKSLKAKVEKEKNTNKSYAINLKYITSRGAWYHHSWKGKTEKSGGIATNIGIHFFDMLTWIFGDCIENTVEEYQADHAAGKLKLQHANVNWFMSINSQHLPEQAKSAGKPTFRSITVDGEEIEFSGGFTDLHTQSYEHILNGEGFGIEQARSSIQLVHDIRNSHQ